MAASQRSTHRDTRDGAAWKPKAFVYGPQVDVIEQTIVDALPKVVNKIVEMAMDGNLAAAKYLVDRILGRPYRPASPPADDRRMPYNLTHLERDQYDTHRAFMDLLNRQLADTKPREPLRFGGMTLEEFQEAAFGPQSKETPEEKFQRMIQAELARREKTEQMSIDNTSSPFPLGRGGEPRELG